MAQNNQKTVSEVVNDSTNNNNFENVENVLAENETENETDNLLDSENSNSSELELSKNKVDNDESDSSDENSADVNKDSNYPYKKRVYRDENWNIKEIQTKKQPEEIEIKKEPNFLSLPGLRKNRFNVWGGVHNDLFGYHDQRFIDYDKNAYLMTNSQHFGFEYYKAKDNSLSKIFKELRFGTNISFYHRGEFDAKTLHAVESRNIPEEIVPEEKEDRAARYWLNLGVFVGIDKKWFGFDFGLTYSMSAFYEKERDYREEDSSIGVAEGRGWTWDDDATLYPNLHIRLGEENGMHFVFNILREDYDPIYGIIQTKIVIPISQYFKLSVGGYMYQTDAFFIQPEVTVGSFSLSAKVGTIFNYQDEDIEKVGVQDSLFGSLSIAFEW